MPKVQTIDPKAFILAMPEWEFLFTIYMRLPADVSDVAHVKGFWYRIRVTANSKTKAKERFRRIISEIPPWYPEYEDEHGRMVKGARAIVAADTLRILSIREVP